MKRASRGASNCGETASRTCAGAGNGIAPLLPIGTGEGDETFIRGISKWVPRKLLKQ